MFGHSTGGATAAQAMYEVVLVDAGINMDGTMGYMPDFPTSVGFSFTSILVEFVKWTFWAKIRLLDFGEVYSRFGFRH